MNTEQRPNRSTAELSSQERNKQIETAMQVLRHARKTFEEENPKLDAPAWPIGLLSFLAEVIVQDLSPEGALGFAERSSSLLEVKIAELLLKKLLK